ncbi:MAG: response regulator [Sphaerochaetaceae bacterium]|nr:response regulator [Sphaerochaetaceae bacterium]
MVYTEHDIALITCTKDSLCTIFDIIAVNDEARMIFGVSKTQKFPVTVESFKQAASHSALLDTLFDVENVSSLPCVFETEDPETYHTYSVQILPARESDSFIISLRDTTERRSCEQLHRTLVASEYDFVGVADVSGLITEVHTDTTGIVLAGGESYVGKTIKEVYGEEFGSPLMDLLKTVERQHDSSSILYHSPFPDDLRRYKITCSEYRRNSTVEFLFAVKDITTDTNISSPFKDNLFLGYIFHTREGLILSISDHLQKSLPAADRDVIGKPVTSILSTFTHQRVCESLLRCSEGQIKKVHCYTDPTDETGLVEVTSLINSGEIEKSQRLLERKISFENLLFDLTGSILRSTEDSLDSDIDRALELLGKFSGADRSYVFLYREDETMDNTHEWVADGITREKDNLQQLPKNIFPNLVRELEEGRDLYFREVKSMGPRYVAEREILLAQSVKSIQFVPLLVHDKSFGFMGFDAVRSNMEWSTEERQLLRYFANNLSEVLARNAYTRELVRLRIEAESLALEKENSHKDLSDFLAQMSHEIRNSVNSILGVSEILLETRMTDHQKRYAEIIRSGSTFLIDLVKDFLDYSKYTRAGINIRETKFSLKTLITRVSEEHMQEIQGKGLFLTTDISPEIPSILLGAPVQISQILKNLIGNAIKFTDSGGITIRATSQQPDQGVLQLILSVSDTGIGIAQDHAQKIFTPFYSTARANRNLQHSSGLGLPIVKSLAENMGGSISVSSVFTEGTTFTVSLPLSFVQEVVDSDVLDSSWQGARAIVIDPDENIARLSSQILSSLSLKADQITSSSVLDQFLSKIQSEGHPYAVCFIDISMVSEQVLETLRICKSRGQYPSHQMFLTSVKSGSFQNLDASWSLFDNTFTIPLDPKKIVSQINTRGGVLHQERVFDYTSFQALSSLHLLIVEDIEINQEVLIYMLDKVGASHSLARDGYEALDVIRKERIDVILLDIRMPGMDGYETARAIRSLDDGVYANIPIVAVTANLSPSEKAMCIREGMHEYLEKPIDKEILYRVLLSYVRAQGMNGSTTPIRLQGFNVDKGLALLHNNREVYLSLLNKFYSSYAAFPSLYKAVSDDSGERIRFVHSVKSVAASLGAEKLAAQASVLEILLNSGTSQGIAEAEQDFLKAFASSIQVIHNSPYISDGQNVETHTSFEKTTVATYLKALTEGCARSDVTVVKKAFREIADYPFTGEAADLFQQISPLISSYNYTEAEPLITSLLELLGSSGAHS